MAFLQETRWKDSISRLIGNGYKLIYTGALSGRNGVTEVLSVELQDSVLEVDRISDRLMSVRVLVNGDILISAYRPQTGCGDAERTLFWRKLEGLLHGIPLIQGVVLGKDLNGHMCDGFEHVHRGFGYGSRNAEGDNILRTCAAANLAIVNTYFKKKPEHLVTYRSGRSASQIDFLQSHTR